MENNTENGAILKGGTNYFTLDYVVGMRTSLPAGFTGGLNAQGNGCLIIRYGGRRIPCTVIGRQLGNGWEIFVKRAHVASGTTLLVAYSFGRVISILKFKRGMGVSVVWDLTVDAFGIDSEMFTEEEVPQNAVTEIIRTSVYPRYMAIFFAGISGCCQFEQTNYLTMKVPFNLAQHLQAEGRTTVSIRSGERLFQDITVGLGHFRGPRWS